MCDNCANACLRLDIMASSLKLALIYCRYMSFRYWSTVLKWSLTHSVRKLSGTYKTILKQELSLPITITDIAIYFLFGALPIDSAIHKRALMLYTNVYRLQEDCIQKQLARRQLVIKGFSSISWLVDIRK